MALTKEQQQLLEEGGPVRPSGDQTPEQALNLGVLGFRHACDLAGLLPVPSDEDVREALAALPAVA